MDDIFPFVGEGYYLGKITCKCGDSLYLQHTNDIPLDSPKTMHECPICGRVVTYKWTTIGIITWEGDRVYG